jgi:hypothetical protein
MAGPRRWSELRRALLDGRGGGARAHISRRSLSIRNVRSRRSSARPHSGVRACSSSRRRLLWPRLQLAWGLLARRIGGEGARRPSSTGQEAACAGRPPPLPTASAG